MVHTEISASQPQELPVERTQTPRRSLRSQRTLTPEEHRRAVFYARFVYIFIAFTFLSICAIAVVTTMSIEQHNTGFKAITVQKPISFFDKTYLKQEK